MQSARIPTCSRAGSIWWNGNRPSGDSARPALSRTGDDGRSACARNERQALEDGIDFP